MPKEHCTEPSVNKAGRIRGTECCLERFCVSLAGDMTMSVLPSNKTTLITTNVSYLNYTDQCVLSLPAWGHEEPSGESGNNHSLSADAAGLHWQPTISEYGVCWGHLSSHTSSLPIINMQRLNKER